MPHLHYSFHLHTDRVCFFYLYQSAKTEKVKTRLCEISVRPEAAGSRDHATLGAENRRPTEYQKIAFSKPLLSFSLAPAPFKMSIRADSELAFKVPSLFHPERNSEGGKGIHADFTEIWVTSGSSKAQ